MVYFFSYFQNNGEDGLHLAQSRSIPRARLRASYVPRFRDVDRSNSLAPPTWRNQARIHLSGPRKSSIRMESNERNSVTLTNPKAVFFDLGHTVLNNDRYEEEAGHRRLLEIAHNPRGASLDDILRTQTESEQAFPESEFVVQPPGVIRSLLIYHRLGMTFDQPPEHIDIEFCKAAHTFSHKPGIENALQTIRTAGLPMAIISNSPFGHRALLWHLEQNKLAHYFDFLVSSTDYGIRKPHPLFMRLPADHLGIDPTEIWFIGDVPAPGRRWRPSRRNGLLPLQFAWIRREDAHRRC